MRRSTIVLLGFFVLIAAVIGYSAIQRNLPTLADQAPYRITVAVDPLAQPWLTAVVERFNASLVPIANGSQRVEVSLTAMPSLRVWQGNANWTLSSHPNAWMPLASAEVDYVPSNLPFRMVHRSTARTPLVWGGWASRVDVINMSGQAFDWDGVQVAAAGERWANIGGDASWGNVNLGIYWPASSSAGLGVLMSAAGHYHQTITLAASQLQSTAWETWLAPAAIAMRNSQRLGESPARAMATRGTSIADFAFLPESQWLTHLAELNQQERFILAYPAYSVIFDFPIAIWENATTSDLDREAVQAFADYVLGAEAQGLALASGLRPAQAEPDETATLFVNALDAGILLSLEDITLVSWPGRPEAERLLRQLR